MENYMQTYFRIIAEDKNEKKIRKIKFTDFLELPFQESGAMKYVNYANFEFKTFESLEKNFEIDSACKANYTKLGNVWKEK